MKKIKTFLQEFAIFFVLIFLAEYYFAYGFNQLSWSLLFENLISILPTVIVVFVIFFFREIVRK